MRSPHIIIVGAGISGLIAARALVKAGLHVILIDKGRAPGGRLASRRIRHKGRTGTFDYGAQSFTVRSTEFARITDEWIDQQIIQTWSDGFYDGNGIFKKTNEPRYKGVQSMRSIADFLATGIRILSQCRIDNIFRDGHRWKLFSDDRREFEADILLLTPPVPQSLALVKNCGIQIEKIALDKLDAARYNPTFTVMAMLDQESEIPDPGGLWLNGDAISWMGDNTKKGISPDAHAVTIHADEDYSANNFEQDRDRIGREILQAAAPHLGARILTHEVHRWKYATPTTTVGEPFYMNESLQLWMAGDSFGGMRLENAALSGLQAAQSIIQHIRS